MNNFNINDKLVSSLKTTSSILTSLFIILLVFCAYLVQRSFLVLTEIPNLIFERGPQLRMWVFQFSYQTLTILWPAIMGGFCFTFYMMQKKRRFIIKKLQTKSDVYADDILIAIDPFMITPKTVGVDNKSFLFRIIALIPMFTLWWHLAFTIIPFFLSNNSFSGLFNGPHSKQYIIIYLLTSLASYFGFLGVFRYKEAILDIISYPEEKAKKIGAES